MIKKFHCLTLAAFLTLTAAPEATAKDWATYEGKGHLANGKRIVLLSGDEEYRSEEGLPMLAKILAARYGFNCTVLFAINPKDGAIDPNLQTNLPGMEALDSADLCVMLLRFRELPDEQMRHFVDYVNAGKPVIGLRTSTHAFAYSRNKQSPFANYDWQSKTWPGGFGQQVLGETWINHHGDHGHQSTRGIISPEFKSHPLLRGVTDIWGPTDVYGVTHLPATTQVLVRGQVLTGMNPTDAPLDGPKNNPMMPLVWIRNYEGSGGKTNQILTTTMGAATDLQSAGLRRLVVNACLWQTGLGKKIPAHANVDYVGEYHPSPFGFGKFKTGVKPADLE